MSKPFLKRGLSPDSQTFLYTKNPIFSRSAPMYTSVNWGNHHSDRNKRKEEISEQDFVADEISSLCLFGMAWDVMVIPLSILYVTYGFSGSFPISFLSSLLFPLNFWMISLKCSPAASRPPSP